MTAVTLQIPVELLQGSEQVGAEGDQPRSDAERRRERLRNLLLWALVPLLAALAYAPVLGMWFVADDFGHLHFTLRQPWPQAFTEYAGGDMFYRPLSTAVIWQLGFLVFGPNALAYHALGLLMHALSAWLLGRAVWTISGEAVTGWLAGAIFAVYPLSTEPVAWLASQWDVWALACALGATWGFAVAWKSGRKLPYFAGLLCAFLAVMMKESALPLPLALPFVALATELYPRVKGGALASFTRRDWARFLRRAALRTLPFFLPSLLFVALRFSGGGMGGYRGQASDWQHFFWDALLRGVGQTFMPLNRAVFSLTFVQVYAATLAVGFLVGLMVWGRRRWPLLLLAAAWALAFVVPALNLLPMDATQNVGNRLLYFSLGGFCIALASILAGLLETPPLRRVGWVGVGLALLLALPVTWIQLQPWMQGSRQSRFIIEEMGRLVAPLPDQNLRFSVSGLPQTHKGSYVLLNGFDWANRMFNNQPVIWEPVEKLEPAKLVEPIETMRGYYNLGFNYSSQDEMYSVSELSGTSAVTLPPAGETRVWDFGGCDSVIAGVWQPHGARFACAPDPQIPPIEGLEYAAFTPEADDGRLEWGEADGIDLTGARWLRLGVCARLTVKEEGFITEWFWRADNQSSYVSEHSKNFKLGADRSWRVYWTYIPVSEVGRRLNALRFDPVNGQPPVDIAWMSLKVIP